MAAPKRPGTIVLDGNAYEVKSLAIDGLRDVAPSRGAASYFWIRDFSGPWGQQAIDMESDKQGHVSDVAAIVDGSGGYLTLGPKTSTQITGGGQASTVMPPSQIGLSSVIADVDGHPYTYLGITNTIWRSDQGAVTFPPGTNPIATIAGAVHLGAMVEQTVVGASRRIWAAGIAQSADVQLYYSDAGATFAATTGANAKGEALAVVRQGGSGADLERLLVARRDGTIFSTDGVISAGAFSSVAEVWRGDGRIQFLNPVFDDPLGEGIWFIQGGRLVNLRPMSQRGIVDETTPAPPLPPLTAGCMWERRPTVTDGYNIWTVLGDRAVHLGLPPTPLVGLTGLPSTAIIAAIGAAGDMLLISTPTDVLAYRAGRWQPLSRTGNGDANCGFLVPTVRAPPDPTYRYILIVERDTVISRAYSVHLPRGMAALDGVDEFTTGVHDYALPRFDADMADVAGTLLGFGLVVNITESGQEVKVLYGIDGAAATTSAGSVTATGLSSTVLSLGSGAGVSFTFVDVEIRLDWGSTATKTPLVYAFAYIYSKRGKLSYRWQITVAGEEWLKDNPGKNFNDLVDQLQTTFDKSTLVTLSIPGLSEKKVRVDAIEASLVAPGADIGNATVTMTEVAIS